MDEGQCAEGGDEEEGEEELRKVLGEETEVSITIYCCWYWWSFWWWWCWVVRSAVVKIGVGAGENWHISAMGAAR